MPMRPHSCASTGIDLRRVAGHTIPAMTQDAIRAWAQKNNMPIGTRGRLPRAVLDAYHKRTGGGAQGALAAEQPPEPIPAVNTYEPLVDYLEPRFGNLYDWDNTMVPYVDENGFDVQPWTEELREAVADYLLHEVSDADYTALLQEVGRGPSDDRAEQVAWITTHNQPWEVAYASHRVATKNAPTLHAVLRHRPPELGPEDLKDDAATWLEVHATYDQLVEVVKYEHLRGTIPTPARYSWHPDPESTARDQLIQSLLNALPLEQLLAAWDAIAGMAPTDLTDQEWSLLEPLLPPGRGTRAAQRQAINGMLFRHAHRGERRSLPPRYGKRAAVVSMTQYYKTSGRLAKALAALEGKPEAARITAWLRSELAKS